MNPSRGEIWHVNLNPTVGHEQAGVRPALVVSVDRFNHGPAGLVVVVPLTTRDKRIASHVRLEPAPRNGLREVSYIKCEEGRCISKQRLSGLSGSVDAKQMQEVEYRLSAILGIG